MGRHRNQVGGILARRGEYLLHSRTGPDTGLHADTTCRQVVSYPRHIVTSFRRSRGNLLPNHSRNWRSSLDASRRHDLQKHDLHVERPRDVGNERDDALRDG
jgi:hypothetical protein